ncbi:MAG: glycosyltransferase family 2 protein [Flavobacteriaceae bacterium]|nr:MAG: glycosyltransferase family 2 protein [Flavobacteriaceae bacterium]
MNLAIVILNWNGKELLAKFLPSVIEHSATAQIYVADNASNDGSIPYLKDQFPRIHLIENPTNGGYANGYNMSLKQIEADVYCLLNNDVEVTANWLDPIFDIFKKEPTTAIVQPKILDFNNKDTFEYAGAAGGFIDKYGFPFCRGRIFNTLEIDEGQYHDNADIFWASGACMFIRKNVFDELNGFDGSFFAHMEEIDLCWRARNLKYNVKYVADSKVYHVGGATLTNTNPQKTYLNFRNSLFMLVKNLPTNKLVSVLFVRLFQDGIAGLRFILRFQFIHFFAVLRSHFSFYMQLIRRIRSRNSELKIEKYYKTKSIVWSYFINKKSVFNRL